MASITYLQEFQPETLRGFVDASQENQTPAIIDRFMGDEVTYNTNFATDIITRSQHIAAMIGLGGQKPVKDRNAVSRVMGELAHFGLQDVVTIEEAYAINQARNDGERSAVIARLINRSQDLLNDMALRVSVEKMKAVALGGNQYNKNGVKVDVDYGIPAEHKKVLLNGNDWAEANHDVIGDLLEWDKQYRDTNKRKADAILMTRTVFSSLTKNQLVIVEAGRPTGATRVSEAELRDVLAGYALPEIVLIEDTTVAVKDVETGEVEEITVFPENRIVFAAEGVGNFLTGPNPDAPNFEPIVFLDVYNERNPKRDIFEVSRTGFAVVDNPNLLLHADVIAN